MKTVEESSHTKTEKSGFSLRRFATTFPAVPPWARQIKSEGRKKSHTTHDDEVVRKARELGDIFVDLAKARSEICESYQSAP
jgi:hypothetical protein